MVESLRRPALPRLQDRLSLGATGLAVSPICLGMVRDPRAVSAAYEAGINFFFLTADMHWPLYEATRQGLLDLLGRPGVRERVVIAVASYVTQPEFCELPLQEVLGSVPALERIDLAVIGGSYSNDFLGRLPIYEGHRRDQFCGIRAVGTTFHDRTTARLAIAHALVDLAFIRYNPVHAGAKGEVLEQLPAASPTRVFNFKSTHGLLSPEWWTKLGMPEQGFRPRVTDYYRFALTPPQMDGALVSLDSPEQVRALADALEQGPLEPGEEQVMLDAGARARGWKR